MKVPLRWLQDYVELPADLNVLTDRVTAIGHMQDHPPVEIADTTVLDLEVRQNRSDCLSILGLAREVSAATDKPLSAPPAPDQISFGQVTKDLVSVLPKTACYRFHAVRLDGIKVGPSPDWLSQRLQAYGIKTINNVVDITNFVMVELGEPLHAFDRAKLHGSLQIRQAKTGETFTMLGNRTITLDKTDIVVADDQGVVSLAGMIGGLDSGVSDTTTSIILEAATYNQANIRRSSLRHSLRTEASLRHEKFLHTALTEVALKRAVDLLQTLAGATVVSQTDVVTKSEPLPRITLTLSRLQLLSGLPLTMEVAEPILKRLGLDSSQRHSDSMVIQVPYFRTDIVQEADVIEEVLRIYGYDQIPIRLPATSAPKDIMSETYLLEERVRDVLVGFGFDEQISEPLTHEADPVLPPVRLQNSLNADKTMLRTSLKPGLVAALEYQQKFRKQRIYLFEVGRVYFKQANYHEKPQLAVLMAGKEVTLAKLKGIWEGLMLRLNLQLPAATPHFEMLDTNVGYFAIDIEVLLVSSPLGMTQVRTSVPQVVFEDLSLITPITTKVGEVMSSIKAVSKNIYRLELGELPHQLDEQTKSLFFKLQYLKSNEQISTEEVLATRLNILQMLEEKFSTKLR